MTLPRPRFPEHEPTHPELPAPRLSFLCDGLKDLRLAARFGDEQAAREAVKRIRSDQLEKPDTFSLYHAAITPKSFHTLLFLTDELKWSPDTLVAPSSLEPARPVALAALASGCWRSASAMLDRTSSPLACDEQGMTPLHFAAMGAAKAFGGAEPLIQRLLNLGADPLYPIPLGEHALAGGSCLHLCAQSAQATALFVSLGLNPNAPAGPDGLAPLALAARNLAPEACLALMRLGANPLWTSASGASALHEVCHAIREGADTHPQDPEHWSAVFEALERAGLSMDDPGPKEQWRSLSPRQLLSGGDPIGEAFAEAFILALSIPSQPSASTSLSRAL